MFVNTTLTVGQYAAMGLPLPSKSGAKAQQHQINRTRSREKVKHQTDNVGKVQVTYYTRRWSVDDGLQDVATYP
jgi:hypothetical protein